MHSAQLFQTLLAFIFVLGLLFITLWIIKYCQQKGLNCSFARRLNSGKRIKVLDHHRLDIKNSLILLQCDDDEILLLTTPAGTTVLPHTTSKKKAK